MRTADICLHTAAHILLSYTTQYGAVLIIFSLHLQITTTAQMLSIGGDRRSLSVSSAETPESIEIPFGVEPRTRWRPGSTPTREKGHSGSCMGH